MILTAGLYVVPDPFLTLPNFRTYICNLRTTFLFPLAVTRLLIAVVMGQGFSCFAQPEGAQYCCFAFA